MLKTTRLTSASKLISGVILLSFLIMTTGCYYFRVHRSSAPPAEEVKRLQAENKFFILHLEDKVWHFKDITVTDSVFSGTITTLSGHQMYKKTTPDEPIRYRRAKPYDESEVLQEVHIYATNLKIVDYNKVIFPPEAINKIEIYDKAIGATVGAWVLSGFGMAATAFGVTTIIVLATSCPFVYPYDGEDFVFTGEIFSGAVQPGLERDDYLHLPGIAPSDGKYRIILTNEIHEIQSVNLAELWIIDHPADMTVLIDKYGTPYFINNTIYPASAYCKGNTDILPLIMKKDSLSYLGIETVIDNTGIEEIILKFPKPEGAQSSKLVIRAKNSLWLDGLILKIHQLFGERYASYSLKQAEKPGEELRKWSLDQKIPLSVFIEKNNRWEFVDYFNLAGPLALKDDILSLDLKDLETDTVKIKLETGFLFWELDYAGMDFTNNEPFNLIKTEIKSAVGNNDTDVRNLMLNPDKAYYVLDKIGDEAYLVFDIPEQADDCRSVFLHSRGYYKIIREQSGEPDKKTLRTFRRPGRVPEYSKEMFDALVNN